MRIDFSKKTHVLFFAVLIPILSFGISNIAYLSLTDPPSWWKPISPLAVYAVLYWIFEKYIWSWRIFKLLEIVTFPDLRGRWCGNQISSHRRKEIKTCIEIEQSFSSMTIRSYYSKSNSESIIADFYKINNQNYLFYTYDNEPNTLKQGTMQNHRGTTKLKLISKNKVLQGSYFNSIGNTGDIELKFESKELTGKFD